VLLMVVDVVVLVLILDHVLLANLQVPLFGSIVLFGRHRSVLGNLALVLRPSVLEPDFHLSFGEVEILSELLPLLPDHVLVLLERLLQLQQLVRRECCSDPFRFSERQQEFGEVWT